MKRHLWPQDGKTKKLIIIGIGVLCLVIVAAGQLLHKNAAAGPGGKEPQTTTVDVLAVKRGGLDRQVTLAGQTVPQAQVDIAAKYQGRVIAVNADLGQQVAAGQELVVQDTGDADLAVLQNQAAYRQASADAVTNEVTFRANYERAKSDYQRALTDYQRYQSLYDMGGVSRQALDNSAQTLANAKATLDTLANQMQGGTPAVIESARAAALRAEHSVSAAAKQREDLVLRAPWPGTIAARQVEVGALVQPGQKLMTVVDNSKIYVDCQLSEQDMYGLAPGQDVSVQLESLGRSFPGKITYISPVNDSQNQSFTVRVTLTAPDLAIRGGMFARATISTQLKADTITVPKEAVLQKNGKTYVYVVTPQKTVEERQVQVGLKGDQQTEITGGLAAGEQIAVSNLSRLRTGLTVATRDVDSTGKPIQAQQGR